MCLVLAIGPLAPSHQKTRLVNQPMDADYMKDLDIEDLERDPEIDRALKEAKGKRLQEQLDLKRRASEDADIKYLDFIVDLQNKLSRVSLGLVTAFAVFLGWVYRDLSTDGARLYADWPTGKFVEIISLLSVAAFLFTVSNFCRTRHHKIAKNRELAEHEVAIEKSSWFKSGKKRRAYDLERKEFGFECGGALGSYFGLLTFLYGLVLVLILVIGSVVRIDKEMENRQKTTERGADSTTSIEDIMPGAQTSNPN